MSSDSNSSKEMERTPKTRPPFIQRTTRNLDWGSALAFFSAAVIGAIGVANNVRNTFWQTFVLGMGKRDTPFAGIRDTHEAMFKQQTNDYNARKINAQEYKAGVSSVAGKYRTAVADKLLKEFDIPTKGFSGWTVGTWKRLQELSLTGRIQSVVGFASVAAITCGAISVLRNSRNTIDRIEDKIDAGQHMR